MSKNSVSYLLQGWRGRGQTPPTLTVVPAALLLEQQRQLSFAHQNPLTPHEIQDESGDDRSVRLNRISGIAIILNTIMFSLEIDFANPTGLPEDRVFWILVESIFIVIFSVEIVLRIHMEGQRWPCSLWNWLDTVLVLFAITETWVLNFLEENGRLRVLGLVRVVRLVRIFRVIRLFRMFHALYVAAMAFKEAMSGLIYICIIMLGGIYVCAIFMTSAVGQSELSELDLGGISGADRFGTVARSMYSLFELLTLENWQLVGRPLVSEQPAMALFFFVYIMIFTFGFLNMVVAVVVERTMAHARLLDSVSTDVLRQQATKQLEFMSHAFRKCDTNDDGMVDRDEFENSMDCLSGPQKALVQCFERLGIPTGDALMLFDILDADASGELSLQEFLQGCARVLGANDPVWDQLATHAVVLGLKDKLQRLKSKLNGAASGCQEADPSQAMASSLIALEESTKHLPLPSSELEDWRRLTERQVKMQSDMLKRLAEHVDGLRNRQKSAAERLWRIETNAFTPL